MNESSEARYFAGFDWATRHHQVVIVDAHGQLVAHFQFDNTAAGWELWRQKIREFTPLAVCVETNQGALVERLLESEGCAVYPIHPKAGKAYCARKAPSGVKTDFREPGLLRMRCGSTAALGNSCNRWTRCWRNCVCFAAMNSP